MVMIFAARINFLYVYYNIKSYTRIICYYNIVTSRVFVSMIFYFFFYISCLERSKSDTGILYDVYIVQSHIIFCIHYAVWYPVKKMPILRFDVILNSFDQCHNIFYKISFNMRFAVFKMCRRNYVS